MSLSPQTTEDKNALNSDAVFLVLLQIDIPSTETIRLVRNNENITWNGYTWIAFPFDFEDISVGKGEVPQYTLKLDNTSRIMEAYVQMYDLYLKQNGIDGNEITCNIYTVNSKDLANITPINNFRGKLSSWQTNSKEASFMLSASNPFQKQFPPRKIFKNFCNWKFKSEQCGYTGSGTFCDKTLGTCRSYNNSQRFGGFAGVGYRGLTII